ncbi:MAG: transposase [Limisphaerales bacterium]
MGTPLPSPNPATKGFASGLHHPLALALTLTRPFRSNGKENVAVTAIDVCPNQTESSTRNGCNCSCWPYNPGNFLREAALPQRVRHWTLTTLREKLTKIGAKVLRQSKNVVSKKAEAAVPRELFWSILQPIGRLHKAAEASG